MFHGRNKREIDISRDELEKIIDQYILHERDRAIMKRRYLDHIKFEPLAEEFDLSVRQVKNVVYKNEDRVLKHI